MATTISTQDLENARRDIDDIGKAVNENVIVSPRYGVPFKSLPMIAAEAQVTIGDWESAIALITQEGGVPALAVSDASGATQQAINDSQKTAIELRLPVFPVKAFGAKGDGATDDRAAIQAAIDACINSGGGTVYFPSTGDDYINGANDYSKFYAVKSTHPDYPNSGLVVDVKGSQYVRGNISFAGEGYNSRIVLGTTSNIDYLMRFTATTNYMNFDRLYLEAGKKAKNALYMADEFHPFMTMTSCTFRGGIEFAAKISTYVSSFTNCIFTASTSGVQFTAPLNLLAAPTTGLTLNSCYASGNTNIGFDFGYLTYCTLNACACDDGLLAYNFGSAYGVTMNACGAERVVKALKAASFRGFVINSFFGLSCGSADALNPTDYMLEFVGGYNGSVAGINFTNPRNFNYILGLTSKGTESENITVLDGSVPKSLAYWVSNYNYDRPIKFMRGDQTEVSRAFNYTTVAELRTALTTTYRYFEINHTITINLANGTYQLGSATNLFRLSGYGELIIQGNPADRAAVKIDTGILNLTVRDCGVRIVFKDLTLTSTSASGSSRRLQVTNSQNVILDNCLIERGAVNTGYGVTADGNSRVSLINNTEASGAFTVGSFVSFDTSEILMPKMAAPPASGTWPVGMKIYNSAPTTHIGWVYSAGAWKAFGVIV